MFVQDSFFLLSTKNPCEFQGYKYNFKFRKSIQGMGTSEGKQYQNLGIVFFGWSLKFYMH